MMPGALLRLTWEAPQEAARWILSRGIAPRLSLLGLCLAAVAQAVLNVLAFVALPPMPVPQSPEELAQLQEIEAQLAPIEALMNQPLGLALFQLASMLLGAVLIHRIGRLFGGAGSWAQTLSLVAWLQLVFVVLQAGELLLALAFPMFDRAFWLFVVFSVVFLTAHFTAALHGFASVAKVAAGIILTPIAIGFALSVLFILLVLVTHV